MTSTDIAASVGVVVIGRNEGERLKRCLGALAVPHNQVVYVDSGSTDGSIEWSRQNGFRVVELDRSKPFSAGRARNAGFTALLGGGLGNFEFVQFIDGDCEVNSMWMDKAVTFLRSRDDVAAVCGLRRERFPERSVYNRLCDVEWNTPVGQAQATGGDSMMRVAAITKVGNFNPDLMAGEEPELCLRLRAQGYNIWRLDADMTVHDANMMHLSQWMRRSRRCGFGFAQVAWLHRKTSTMWWREIGRALLWALAIPIVILIITFFTPWGLLLLLIYPLQVVRIAARQGITSLIQWQDALFMTTMGKFGECAGILQFAYQTWKKQDTELIEYKNLAP